ncbi:cytochrome c oxidase assembly protein [Thermobifida halotolerans]|uniref:Cytochrome c oxidase assembly protein n=1 Tax=Thermobifida halotolerans TaxID=483545 RepID=A0AA97LZV6_9ACTN|nr:cytochrome c oxidase assembly protein [Thermobifida halotolerans]UOE21039.1 cytochrome c oxidase assembly protein [Thermobifida halotolerans]
MHPHGPDPAVAGWVAAAVAAAAVGGYLAAAAAVRRRGTAWSARRVAAWTAGWACAVGAVAGPMARLAHHDFVWHMAGHVLLGMLAPLLLAVAAPVTLALRVLPTPHGRRLVRLLRSPPVAVATHPVVAAVLNVGGLWVLYHGGLYAVMLDHAGAHALVHVHVLVAGWVFTFAVLGGPDPAPHRMRPLWRAGVLVGAVAAHNVLAKTLYAAPPAGVPVEQAQVGAQVMYYGGMPVEIALAALLCRDWLGPRAGRTPARLRCRGAQEATRSGRGRGVVRAR